MLYVVQVVSFSTMLNAGVKFLGSIRTPVWSMEYSVPM